MTLTATNAQLCQFFLPFVLRLVLESGTRPSCWLLHFSCNLADKLMGNLHRILIGLHRVSGSSFNLMDVPDTID